MIWVLEVLEVSPIFIDVFTHHSRRYVPQGCHRLPNAILKILIRLTIKIVYFTRFSLSLQPKPKHITIMTTIQLNNLWTYIQGMALKKKDREWLAGKLLEPTADDAKTAQQKAYVKESLYRALDEVERAKRGEHKMMTEEEFLEGLKKEGIG